MPTLAAEAAVEAAPTALAATPSAAMVVRMRFPIIGCAF
jgi:hypothetical protein